MTEANTRDAEVIIVGGGPVGMGLAIDLGQRGIKTIVVERYPQPQPVPKGQNLTQRTMEHFHAWGAEEELRAARTMPKEFGIGGLTSHGTLLSDYHYDWLQRALVRQYYYRENERLPQYATEAVLRERAAALPSVETLYGWDAVGVSQDGDGVTIEIQEHKGDGRRALKAAYAVGCDGSRSVVREMGGMTQSLSDHDRKMVLLVFRSPELHQLLERYPGKSYFNVLHPDLKGYWMFFGRVDLGNTWFFHAPVPQDTTKDNFDFKGYLHRAAGADFDVELEHVGFWDLRFAVADDYRKGRLFIAGDAAHSHPPYGGYGINTGFEDARNLGWKLAAALKGWGGDALLDSYSAERQPVFASTAADFIEKSINTDRDFLAAYDPGRDRAAFEKEWNARGSGAAAEVDAFEPNYEGSPIVCDDGSGTPSAKGHHAFTARAGHHLAPQVLASGANAFERLGEGFTLFTFSADKAVARAFQSTAQRMNVPLNFVSEEMNEAAAKYDARYMLVRPDAFVAWAASEAPEDVEGILATAAGIDA